MVGRKLQILITIQFSSFNPHIHKTVTSHILRPICYSSNTMYATHPRPGRASRWNDRRPQELVL